MHRVIKCLAAASTLAGFASAQTIHAPEGDWVWNAELNVNGLTLANAGNTCLSSESAQIDLSAIVSNLNETCSISDWNEEGDAIYFALKCSGEYLANMTGEIALGEEDASFTLAGAVRLGDAGPVSTVINGKAARNGVCAVPTQPVAAEPETLAVAYAEDVAPAAQKAESEGVEIAAAPEAAVDATEVAKVVEVAVNAQDDETEASEVAAVDVPKAAPVASVEVTALISKLAEAVAEAAAPTSQEEADA